MLFRPDEGWRAFTPQQLKELGIWPNRIEHNKSTGESVRYRSAAAALPGLFRKLP